MAAPARIEQLRRHNADNASERRSSGSHRPPAAATDDPAFPYMARPRGLDPWQRASYDDWVARLGPDRMDGVLRTLRDQLRGLLHSTSGADRPAVHRLAHDAASTAGMLGFLEVTRCCRAMLEAKTEDEETPARATLQHALEAALGRLGRHFADFPERGTDAVRAKAAAILHATALIDAPPTIAARCQQIAGVSRACPPGSR